MAEPINVLEIDELWSFVICKINHFWLWLAICRCTRQVVAYAIGDRSVKTCQCMWDAILTDYRPARCFHDFWEAYAVILPPDQHTVVGKGSGQPNYVERFNNTPRQQFARLGWKSLLFSQSAARPDRCICLFLRRYNQERISILD